MIGTAFYALGVIACMILIVVAAIVGIGALILALPYLIGIALLIAILWSLTTFFSTSFGHFAGTALLVTGGIAFIVWIAWLLLTIKSRREAKTRADRERWIEMEKNWNECKSPPPWMRRAS
jgi:steroid 5-alpha reductase family enzyme